MDRAGAWLRYCPASSSTVEQVTRIIAEIRSLSSSGVQVPPCPSAILQRRAMMDHHGSEHDPEMSDVGGGGRLGCDLCAGMADVFVGSTGGPADGEGLCSCERSLRDVFLLARR